MKARNLNIYHKLPILDGLEWLDARGYTLNFPFHTHPTFNITLIREQLFTTKVSGKILHAAAGHIVITNPGEVHATICDNQAGSSFFTYYVPPDVLRSLNGNKPVYFEQKVIEDPFLFAALSELAGNYNEHTEQKLSSILKKLVAGYAQPEELATPHEKLFRKFMEETHAEKFSLEQTARQFGLDKYKFLRLFKQQTGLTPNNYIILRRIEEAKVLLQTGEDLLGIAVSTGFCDTTHLCKHFKRMTGVSPLAYRNAILCNIIQ